MALRKPKANTWEQLEYTGTGFPGYGVGERIRLAGDTSALAQGRELARGFMINYNMYRHYFPLMALARARKHFGEGGATVPTTTETTATTHSTQSAQTAIP